MVTILKYKKAFSLHDEIGEYPNGTIDQWWSLSNKWEG